MPAQIDLDRAYLDIAERWSEMSKARRLKVGCIIVKDMQIISDGYNGTPIGFDNNCEDLINGELVTKQTVLHAESNALMKLACSENNSRDSTMYLTHTPCFNCAKLIIQARISRVVFKYEYDTSRSYGSVELLNQAGVIVELINN